MMPGILFLISVTVTRKSKLQADSSIRTTERHGSLF